MADTTPLLAAAGIDNRTDETKLRPGFVREAINVDITADGVVSRRKGRRKVIDTTLGHSGWADASCPFALVMDGGTLLAIWADYSTDVVRAGMAPRDTYYQFLNGQVYYSNGVESGCVRIDGSSVPWGLARPGAAFSLAATATGGLHAGTYQVALTFQNASREESGAAESLYVDVPEGGGIALDNLPAPTDDDIIALRVYVSKANDERLFFARDIAPGATTATIGAFVPGKPLRSQFLDKMPPCKYLLKYNGRMLGANGKYVFFSDSLLYGLSHETKGHIRFGEEVTAIAAPEVAGTQLYIGTAKKTYLYKGAGLYDGALSIVAHHGIVPGSTVMVPGELLGIQGVTTPVPMWLGTNGTFYIGTENTPLPIRGKNVAADIPAKAAGIFMERDGLQQMLLSYYGGHKTNLAVSDRAIARVYDKSE